MVTRTTIICLISSFASEFIQSNARNSQLNNMQLTPQVDWTHSITYIRAKKCICQQISKALKTITTCPKDNRHTLFNCLMSEKREPKIILKVIKIVMQVPGTMCNMCQLLGLANNKDNKLLQICHICFIIFALCFCACRLSKQIHVACSPIEELAYEWRKQRHRCEYNQYLNLSIAINIQYRKTIANNDAIFGNFSQLCMFKGLPVID